MQIYRRTFLTGSAAAAVGFLSLGGVSLARNQKITPFVGSTPIADGFRMPGEFEPQEAIWLVWPETSEWRHRGKPAEKAITKLAQAISGDIPVRLAVSKAQASKVRSMMPSGVEVVEINAGTGWVRDDGPTFLINDKGDRRGVDWVFNDWGYPEQEKDTSTTAQKLINHEKAVRYRAPLVLEGGSIHSDGQGTIITTEECLLNPNRNPGLTKKDIEDHLKNYLGAKKIIWLPFGVFKDSTSGHVDNMCCFAAPGEVLLTWTDDQDDEQYERSRKALEVLEASTDANGSRFKVHKLHQPGPLYMTEGERNSMPDSMLDEDEWDEETMDEEDRFEDRMPGSYINYILTNNRVIFPLLDPQTDPIAKETFARAFPKHEIIGVEGREILLHGGNFHCISQNLPARFKKG